MSSQRHRLPPRDRAMIAAGFLLVVASLGCQQQSPTTEAAPAAAAAPGVLVNVTRGEDDLHAVSMGLNLAKHAAERGLPVVVFLNVAAPIFASSALPAETAYEDFPPVRVLLEAVLAAGGKVLVCKHCAQVSGVDASTLLPGVVLSEHGALLEALTPGMVGFSY